MTNHFYNLTLNSEYSNHCQLMPHIMRWKVAIACIIVLKAYYFLALLLFIYNYVCTIKYKQPLHVAFELATQCLAVLALSCNEINF